MSYGVIEYNSEGKPKCEICGKYFKRVISHVRQKHDMNEKEYKTTFGFDLHKGICSKDSSEKSRKAVYENYDKCINNNLISKGNKTRFISGHKGRTKNKVSEQTRLRLIEHAKNNITDEQRKLNGKKLGESGLGNKSKYSK